MKQWAVILLAVLLLLGGFIYYKKHRRTGNASLLFRGGPLVVSVADSCDFGDLDAMEQEMSRSTQPRFLVTVESLSNSARKPYVAESTSLADLAKGLTLTFPGVPREEGGLGFYICRDLDGKGSCRGKEILPLTQVVLKNVTAKAAEIKPDRLYYFQPLFIDGAQIAYLTRDKMEPAQRDAFLRSAGSHVELREVSAAVAALKSRPLEVGAREIRLMLAKFRADYCAKGAPWTPPK